MSKKYEEGFYYIENVYKCSKEFQFAEILDENELKKI